MLKKFITEICKILDISIPILSFDTSHFSSNTMMGQCNSSGTTIFLRRCDKLNPDYLFAVAHELRHIWQIRTNNSYYFSNYKTVDVCSSKDEYNLQLAEIDANAFATLVMIEFFQLKPSFDGLSSKVPSKIQERMEFIIEQFG